MFIGTYNHKSFIERPGVAVLRQHFLPRVRVVLVQIDSSRGRTNKMPSGYLLM